MAESTQRRVFGVVVTYERPEALDRCLDAIAGQRRGFDGTIVVDNSSDDRSRSSVDRHRDRIRRLEYRRNPVNLGPAGGRQLGASAVMREASDDDVIVFVDDDDPPPSDRIIERLLATLDAARAAHPSTAGVGLRGARLDRRTGQIRPATGRGLIEVDHLHGGFFPSYLVGPLRRVGSYDPELFFGFEELDLGLKLRRAGWTMFADADMYESVAASMGHGEPFERPRARLSPPSQRRYYALRNRLVVLGREHLYMQASAWALIAGIAKPLAWLPIHPKVAVATLRLNASAIRDAMIGRLGQPRTSAAAIGDDRSNDRPT
jgi:glycosyltransferase involved in cell wall biosynthesis